MDERNRELIEERLLRLEQENRRLARQGRWLMRAALAGVVALAVSVSSQVLAARPVDAQSRELTAETLTIRDASGRVRGVFGVDSSGGVGLSLIGGPDALQPGGTSGAVTLYADSSQSHVRAANGQDGDSPSVFLGSMRRGSGFFGVVGGSGDTIFSLP